MPGSRFSKAENTALVSALSPHFQGLFGDQMRNTSSNERDNIWLAITDRVNRVSDEPRSVLQVKKRLADMKCRLRRILTDERLRNGGRRRGARRLQRPPVLKRYEERLRRLMGLRLPSPPVTPAAEQDSSSGSSELMIDEDVGQGPAASAQEDLGPMQEQETASELAEPLEMEEEEGLEQPTSAPEQSADVEAHSNPSCSSTAGPGADVAAAVEDDETPLLETGVSSAVAGPSHLPTPSLTSPHPEPPIDVCVLSTSVSQPDDPTPSTASSLPLEPNVVVVPDPNVPSPVSPPPRVSTTPPSVPPFSRTSVSPPTFRTPPFNFPFSHAPPPFVFFPHPRNPASGSTPSPRYFVPFPQFPFPQSTPSSVRPPMVHAVFPGSSSVRYEVDPAWYIYVSESLQRLDATQLGAYQQLGMIQETLLGIQQQQRELIQLLQGIIVVAESQPTQDEPREDASNS